MNNLSNDIFVFAEINNDKVNESTYELLAKAQELSQKNHGEVFALLLETTNSNHAEELIAYGADKVIELKDDLFANYDPIIFKDAIVPIVKKFDPAIFLLPATFIGRSIAPRIQGALQTGLTADCLDLDINEDNKLVQIKPSYGDNLMCTIIIPEKRPQMTTVRPMVFKALEPNPSRLGVIIKEKVNLNKTHIFEVLETENLPVKDASLTGAKNVVAIGRGIKSKDDLGLIENLATNLDAKIGVTRPFAENGWYTVDEQIGQSGVTINPDLILNLGIAGAVQYTVGMKDAKVSVSVNKDKDASIFKESDYGYVGDAKSFANELIKQLSK